MEEVNRKSEDKVVNDEGKKLINFCTEMGLKIRNGDTNGDWDGKLTFIGEGGASVLDLVLEIESEGESIVENLTIKERIESDHLPVLFKIRAEITHIKETKTRKERKRRFGYGMKIKR